MKQVSGQMSLFDLDMPCGRTSPEHSLPTKGRTSASSSKSFAKSKTKEPMFLDLSGGGGNLAGVSWETGIPWLGASSTLNFGEYPNVAEESGLSQILEESVPQRYYLSERACVGVLRRAERRGKELKPILKLALEQQIERWRKYGSPLPVFEREEVVVECYDARGNGDGKVVPTITGDHNSRITDYTAVVCEKYAANSSGNDIAGTIDSHYYLGCGARGGKEREFVAIAVDRSAFNQGENAKYNIGVDENGTAFTVTAKGPGAVCYCLQGNGIDRADTAGCNGKGVKENESYTLNTIDRHAVCYGEAQPHQEVMRLREGKEGGGKGALIQTDISGTIACNNDQTLFQQTEVCYIVRRLTPLECCRLQGFPDWWVSDIPHSDAQEYKMWGNGMALPNALYIMEGLVENDER